MLTEVAGNGNLQTRCIHCWIPIELSAASPIRIGSLVKFDEDEEVMDLKGETVIVTRTKVFPASVKGPGCITCQYEYIKGESAELGRRAQFRDAVQEVHDTVISVSHEGKTYEQRGEKWYDVQTHISVPVLVGHVLRKIEERVEHQESRKVLIGNGLDKRQAFIDVRELVLAMSRRLQV